MKIKIGDKIGCFTVISDPSDYYEKFIKPEIEKLIDQKQQFLAGEVTDFHKKSNIESVESYDRWINSYKSKEMWKVKCKCGKEHYYNRYVLSKRRRYCTPKPSQKPYHLQYTEILNDDEQCGLRKEQIRKIIGNVR